MPLFSEKPTNSSSASLPLRPLPNTVLLCYARHPQFTLNHPRTLLLHGSRRTRTATHHIQKRSPLQAPRNFLRPGKGMSSLLKIYREHALELLYQPPRHIDVDHKPRSSSYLLDLRVVSQGHPAFPLYLLMSAPRFCKVCRLMNKQESKPRRGRSITN